MNGMKLIHCGDLGLCAALPAFLSEEQQEARREELFATFERMLTYADRHQVAGVLIAGGLFGRAAVYQEIEKRVRETMAEHPYLSFFYLPDGDGRETFLYPAEPMPENLFVFNESVRKYRLPGNIVITGQALADPKAFSEKLDRRDFNIVMLRGKEIPAGEDFAGRGIDYLALGGRACAASGRIDDRGIFSYAGCLEGTDFSEAGQHGFKLLDIDESSHTYRVQLLDDAMRHPWMVPVDVSGLETIDAIMKRVRAVLSLLTGTPSDDPEIANVPLGEVEEILGTMGGRRLHQEDLVEVMLRGSIPMEMKREPEAVEKALNGSFYVVSVQDETYRVGNEKATPDTVQQMIAGFSAEVEHDGKLSKEAKRYITGEGAALILQEGAAAPAKLKERIEALSPNRRTGEIFQKRMAIEQETKGLEERPKTEEAIVSNAIETYDAVLKRQALLEQKAAVQSQIDRANQEREKAGQQEKLQKLYHKALMAQQDTAQALTGFFGAENDLLTPQDKEARLLSTRNQAAEKFKDKVPALTDIQSVGGCFADVERDKKNLTELREKWNRTLAAKKKKEAVPGVSILGAVLLVLGLVLLLMHVATVPAIADYILIGVGALLMITGLVVYVQQTNERKRLQHRKSAEIHEIKDRIKAEVGRIDALLDSYTGTSRTENPDQRRRELFQDMIQDATSYYSADRILTLIKTQDQCAQEYNAYMQAHPANIDEKETTMTVDNSKLLVNETSHIEHIKTLEKAESETTVELQTFLAKRRDLEIHLYELDKKERIFQKSMSSVNRLEERYQLLTTLRDYVK